MICEHSRSLRLHASTLALVILLLVGSACPLAGRSTVRPVASAAATTHGPAIFSVSETSAVLAVAEFGKAVYVGDEGGLHRYDAGSGKSRDVMGPTGQKLGAVMALAAGSNGLWLFVGGAILHRQGGVWKPVPAGGPTQVSALHATSTGVLAGGDAGLAELDKGHWRHLLPGAKVRLLVDNRAGRGVWVGTDGEGLYQLADGKLQPHAADRGQQLKSVHSITYTKEGGLLALGSDQQSRKLLTYFDGRHWATYWPPPGAGLTYLAQVGGKLLLGAKGGVFELRRGSMVAGAARPPSVLRLSGEVSRRAPRNYPIPYFYTRQSSIWLPPAPTVVVDRGDHVLLGTRRLGTAHYDGKRLRWFRAASLTAHVDRLLVGCARGACFLAAGGKGYRYAGKIFSRANPTAEVADRVQAFVDDGKGRLWSLHTPGNQISALVVSELGANGRVFTPRVTVEAKVPSGSPLVRFVRLGPKGKLWVGLRYRDAEGELRNWGVLVIDLADGSQLFHRSSTLPSEDRPAGSLALPDDLRDVFFRGGELFFATGMGICHVVGKKVTQITENEGLASELVYMVGQSPEGQLLAATYAGLGRFDGKYWRFDSPTPLDTRTRGLLVEGDVLWAATAKGVARLAKGKVTVIGARQGLASDHVLDLRRVPETGAAAGKKTGGKKTGGKKTGGKKTGGKKTEGKKTGGKKIAGQKAGKLWVLTRGGLSIVDAR